MSTFQELQALVADKKNRLVVLRHLIEYIDENFRSVAGGDSKNKLLNDEKIPVSESVFESVVNDVLLDESKALHEELNQILSTQMVPAPPPAAAPAAETTTPEHPEPVQQPNPEPPPAPATRKKKKG